jgi:chromate transporter
MAGVLFVLPGAILMALISIIYVTWGQVPLVAAVFYGLKPAVIAIVAAAVLRIGKKTLKSPGLWAISAAAFTAIFFFNVAFPMILIAAALIGWFGGRIAPDPFSPAGGHGVGGDAPGACIIGDLRSEKIPMPSLGRALRTLLVWSAVWIAPVLLAWLIFGGQSLLVSAGLFFSKAALVTFGGAYAVLPYVAQQAVESYGLGLAETTPGPLILVLQFVGFMAGWNAPEALPPMVFALAVAAMTTWVTFVPGFLFIFVGAPFVESSRGHRGLNAALSGVTAAVVGVILNLAVWFGYHVLVPDGVRWDWMATVATIGFFFLLQKLKWDVLYVIGAGAAFGLVTHGWLTVAP